MISTKYRHWPPSWSWLFYLVFLRFSSAASTNRTIDDTNGDSITGIKPVYLPTTTGVWKNAGCGHCAVTPDKLKAFQGTWTSATYNPGLNNISVNFNFEGTAIYIFFILANNVAPGITTKTTANFMLDGVPAGSYLHTPNSSSDLTYNELAFTKQGLLNKNHSFGIVTTGSENILVTFDYAMYTFVDQQVPASSPGSSTRSTLSETRSSTPSNPSRSGSSSRTSSRIAIASIVVPVIFIIIGIIVFFKCHRRGARARMVFPVPNSDAAAPTVRIRSHPSRVNLVSQGDPSDPGSMEQGWSQRRFIGDHVTSLPSGEIVMSPGVVDSVELASNRSHSPPITETLHSLSILNSQHPPLAPSPSPSSPNNGSLPPSDPVETPNRPEPTQLSQAVLVAPPMPPSFPPSEKSDLHRVVTQRQIRQAQLEQRMEDIRQGIEVVRRHSGLTMNSSADTTSSQQALSQGGDDEVVKALREQINMMQRQIEVLQEQQQSEWAMGLTDDPPPMYSPDGRPRHS
ncbi:hypothetical protein HGRIS_012751 [Hohenbuehelia grisea]|uniref:Uncharacterized protein n=1 Tax=Hohenbuehelia grisea TaxID=104357 RepID=A0ABR3IT84_9AGAR